MPRNKITDLRDHLFETIEKLQSNEIEIDRALAIRDVAQVIVNSAKVEVDFLNKIGGDGTGFIPERKVIEA